LARGIDTCVHEYREESSGKPHINKRKRSKVSTVSKHTSFPERVISGGSIDREVLQ